MIDENAFNTYFTFFESRLLSLNSLQHHSDSSNQSTIGKQKGPGLERIFAMGNELSCFIPHLPPSLTQLERSNLFRAVGPLFDCPEETLFN